ncbi:GTP cyclohydrolase II [Maribacter confluentis]|uniref:GTP cyclohydrolase-2 n=2 Tax=Maribacter confluentis TaxID=1656093 RepID=A0ABT8RND7_9FLAO|nr:GTP cyclohydrolase II [Maribacter confluentis]MDO1512425.1 GTP cyclohydrolase II [Maribacter confluentis]
MEKNGFVPFYLKLVDFIMNIQYSNTAQLPTAYGKFNIISFKEEGVDFEHCVLYKGELETKENVLTRLHSECLTGDVFASKKCDCGEQLEESLRAIAEKGSGIVLYLRQEGRGIGLFNKINAYALQDEGQDTIQANHSLGFDTDLRDFTIAAKVLEHLKVKSIELLSNNPEKIEVLENAGIIITKRVPLITKTNVHNQDYLNIKKVKLKHLL